MFSMDQIHFLEVSEELLGWMHPQTFEHQTKIEPNREKKKKQTFSFGEFFLRSCW